MQIPVQNTDIDKLVDYPINIGNKGADNTLDNWEENNAYVAHFLYEPSIAYSRDKIISIYKQQIHGLKTEQPLAITFSLLKNGIPYN